MNKNRQEYINAINKIEVSEEMKEKCKRKIKEKNNHKRAKISYIYAISSIILVLVLTIGISYRMIANKNKVNRELLTEIKEGQDLPTLGSFENLYKMLHLTNQTRNKSMVDTVTGYGAESQSMDAAKVEGGATSSDDYSETNIQVEGVDEADIVKTDGDYIYYVSTDKIVIVESKNPSELKIVKEIKYEETSEETYTPQEVFVNNDKLVVIGMRNVYEKRNNQGAEVESGRADSKIALDRMYPIHLKGFTTAKVYNVANKSNVKLDREIEVEGNYLTARMIGDNIYFLANQYLYTYSYIDTKMEEMNEDDFKPYYRDTAVSTEEKCVAFPDIYYYPGSEEQSYLNIVGFNVTNNKEANMESFFGAGQNIYASENNLYVANTKYEYKNMPGIWYENSTYNVNTTIYKFKIENAKVHYEKAGTVPGTILNQFSMDENNGYFRVATTNNNSWSNTNSTNNMYVLNENMELVGKIEDLAKGEQIYSVRFMGDRAYMVTFVQTDPLFVIDLSNPTNPKVLGELKIPGYSKYLHPYDENHIIGFGEDTKTVNYGYGEVVTTNGMKMALFDVTDPSNPKEMYSLKIGEKGTYSELLYDHKALLFSKEKNIIAFPITITQGDDYTSNLKFQGAIVYGIDLQKGFTLRGQIAHKEVQNGYFNYDYEKIIERILYIKNDLYTLSKGLIKATDMNTMQEKGKVEIEVEQPIYRLY